MFFVSLAVVCLSQGKSGNWICSGMRGGV
ncbi:hypothetical protein DFAR_3940003 [Desulfarculales bacterium]